MNAPTPSAATQPRHHLDRGSTTVEMVGYTTVWMLALLIAVQTAVWGLAQISCQYAASHALQTTRIMGGSAAAGHADAVTVLDQISSNLVADPDIHITRDQSTATVTVRASTLRLVPLVTPHCHASATGPVETLTP